MMKKMKFELILFFITLAIFSCKTNVRKDSTKVVKISPPLPELVMPYSEFEVNAQQINTFDLASGTKLTVYPNTLIDAAGSPLKGKATLKYREYHDAVEVFLSGIPMNYEQGGRSHTMQTAGMFDIQCQQNGQQIFLKEGSGVLVEFASTEVGLEYNFFRLDSTEGWQFVNYVAPTINQNKSKIKQQIRQLNRQLKKKQPPYFIFGFDSALDIKYNNDWTKLQANRKDEKLLKRLDNYQIQLIGREVYEMIDYEGRQLPAGMIIWMYANKKTPAWMKKIGKDDALKLEKKSNNHYLLHLTKSQGKKYVTSVKVVAPLKYIFEYSAQKWKNNFATVLQEIAVKEERVRQQIEAAQKRMEQEAAVIRSFEIQGFGIYNYDKLMDEGEKIEVLATFEKTDAAAVDLVFCFPKDNKTIIKYPKSEWDKVVLLPDDAMRFVSVGIDQSIAIYDAEAYRQLDFKALQDAGSDAKVHFELRAQEKKLINADNLRTLLNM